MVILFFLFLVVLFAEGYLILVFAAAFGGWNTVGLIVLTSLVGAVLVRREGLSVLRSARQSLDRGQIPTNELINGVLLLVAASLILTPGFLTAGVGLLLLFPPTKAVVRKVLKASFAGRLKARGTFRRPGLHFGRWTDVNATDVSDAGEAAYRDATNGDGSGSAIELGAASDEAAGSDADDRPDADPERR